MVFMKNYTNFMKMSKISECTYTVTTSNMTTNLIIEKSTFTRPGKRLIIGKINLIWAIAEVAATTRRTP